MNEEIRTVVLRIIEKFPLSKKKEKASREAAAGETIRFKNLDEFKSDMRNIRWDGYSVEDLRLGRTLLTPSCNNLEVENGKLKYYQAFSVLLMQLERARPIDEQFSYLCNDLDGLLIATASLEKSTHNLLKSTTKIGKSSTDLEKGAKNKSKEMETTVNASFLSYLRDVGWSAAEVRLCGGIIHKLDLPKEQLVQWDGLVSATNESTGEQMLFLLETKEIAHHSDIIGRDNCLYNRGLRTYTYIEQLRLPDDKAITYSEDNKLQHGICRLFLDHKITLVYASGILSDEIRVEASKIESEFKKLTEHKGKKIQVWLMECPRFTSAKIFAKTDNNWKTDYWSTKG